ncbi:MULTISPECIES: hypothetical protein [Halocynthiibacter]|uniref:hypothetical protein n=1 Tax=Halocynthiibacter TaxID=1579315 RepID=UPI0021F111CC|nr:MULTISPECIES: hypothetical protein [Halocynthiibacter]
MKFPAISCLPRAKEPIVRGSGCETKPVAGRENTLRRAWKRSAKRLRRVFVFMVFATCPASSIADVLIVLTAAYEVRSRLSPLF